MKGDPSRRYPPTTLPVWPYQHIELDARGTDADVNSCSNGDEEEEEEGALVSHNRIVLSCEVERNKNGSDGSTQKDLKEKKTFSKK